MGDASLHDGAWLQMSIPSLNRSHATAPLKGELACNWHSIVNPFLAAGWAVNLAKCLISCSDPAIVRDA
jgi:hypothetical protein